MIDSVILLKESITFGTCMQGGVIEVSVAELQVAREPRIDVQECPGATASYMPSEYDLS